MKLMKKICLALAVVQLLSFAMLFPTGAKEFTPADKNLLIHWDFEGDTVEEQLANKAPGRDRGDCLVFGTDGEKSSISDGLAHIGSEATEYLVFDRSKNTGNTNMGKSLFSIEGNADASLEYTFYIRFRVDEEESLQFASSPFYILGSSIIPVRLYLQGEGSVGLKPSFRILNDGKTDTRVENYRFEVGSFVGIAFTAKKNSDGTVTYTLHQAGQSVEIQRESALRLMNWNGIFYFGAGKAYNQNADYGKDYTYDDIRIYNRALSAGELAAIDREFDSHPATTDPAAPVMVGLQTRNLTADAFDVRLVAKIDSLDYTEVGFCLSMEAWTETAAGKDNRRATGELTERCHTVYRYLGYRDESGNAKTYDAGEGSFYAAVSLTGIPLTEAADVLEITVTAYGIGADGTRHTGATYRITLTDGTRCEVVPVQTQS